MENRLGREKSPYLLQHKNNPIHWRAWGEDAFKEAREKDKLIFLSIGYSTCHWCHVMAHESFENQAVADVLNKDFISIKVDREERPDVDDVYMKALLMMNGGGGWPLSVWLTPDGRPFFAGTYFPRDRFLQILARIQDVWTTERSNLLADAENLLNALKTSEEGETETPTPGDVKEYLDGYIGHFHHAFDERFGGFGRAPKFPQSMNLMVMMRQDFKNKMEQAEALVNRTLEGMSRGGMYDHLKGGFHRYSVDQQWLVPHFEKMLYDQAMIALALIDSEALYKTGEFKAVVYETLDYVLNSLTHEDGGFFAAEDADSLDPQSGHKEEGFFATFSYSELEKNLSKEELEQVKTVYGATEKGNFEGRNILHLQDEFDHRFKKDAVLAGALKKLETLRDQRPAPHRDEKIIAAWNGWMICAFARAARAYSEPRYLKAAQRALEFVKKELWQDGELKRYFHNGTAEASAVSEDYAALIWAALELNQADFNDEWAHFALALQNKMDRLFWDPDSKLYFSADGRDSHLLLRGKDNYDGVHPASNSMAFLNLLRLHLLTGDGEFLKKSDAMIESLFPLAVESPTRLPFFSIGLDAYEHGLRAAVIGEDKWALDFYKKESARFHPYILWVRGGSVWSVARDKNKGVSVCAADRCLSPAQDEDQALLSIQGY